MPYDIHWYVPGYVIYTRFRENVTPQEFRQYLQVADRGFFDAGIGPLVHIVIDVRQAASMPTLRQLSHAIGNHVHPKMGWALVIGTVNPTTSWIGNFVAQLFRFRFRRFGSVPDALAYLREMDGDIDWTVTNDSILPSEVQ